MPRSLDALITDLDILLGDLVQAKAEEAGVPIPVEVFS